jgi:hypothetical protein
LVERNSELEISLNFCMDHYSILDNNQAGLEPAPPNLVSAHLAPANMPPRAQAAPLGPPVREALRFPGEDGGKSLSEMAQRDLDATLARLEELFATTYPINRGRAESRGPAMGRYAGDRYFSGGAYYFSTLGAAEFYYALAEAVAGAEVPVTADNKEFLLRLGAADDSRALPPPEHRKRHFEALLRRGDQFMATVSAYTPACGELSEQFDQATGVQTSAKSLAWSHAALITAVARRRAALRTGVELSQSGAAP